MTELMKQELRGGWLGVPKQYQVIDLLGIALGSYFLYEGATGKGPPWLTGALGAIMIYIHTQRFFYAPQTRDGLIKLMQSLDVTPEELTGQLINEQRTLV